MTETYRQVRESDFEDMHAGMQTYAVVRQLGSWPWPPQEAFTRKRARPYEGDGFVWAICRDDRYIGSIAVTGHEVGYGLHPDYHRQGIISRALPIAIREGFEVLDRTMLVAAIWFDNPGSRKLLTRHGFQQYCTRYERSRARGFPVITHRFRLLRRDWVERKGRIG